MATIYSLLPSNKALKIAIVAGEVSGDILATNLIKELKTLYPNAEFEGVAGEGMKAEGCRCLFDMEELAVMGLVEVLGRLWRLLSIRRQLVKHWQQNPPDIFIGVDAPDFNINLELKLKSAGIKTVHYVSPSVWAWRQKRIFKIAKATDLVLALLPFEKQFYDEHKVPCQFVGHTLADQIPLINERKVARDSLCLDDKYTIALLCGSRSSEIALLSEPFAKSLSLYQAKFPQRELQIVAACLNEKKKQQLSDLISEHAPELDVIYIIDQSREVMAAADCILMASGTATLEAALIKRPMVVAYRFKALSYHIFKRLVKVSYFSLPNLIAGKKIVPELLQDEVNAERLVEELDKIASQSTDDLQREFDQIHHSLRLDAGKHAAQAIAGLIND